MITLGVTGSMASGKSTIGAVFAGAGIPVFDADSAVHEMYLEPPPQLVDAVPGAVVDGRIDRGRLSEMLVEDPGMMASLEAITHPFVLSRATAFLEAARSSGEPIAVLDVPLLFESGLDSLCDRTLVTVAPEALREERIIHRSSMSEALRRLLQSRQMPDVEKTARADYVVDTTRSEGEVEAMIRDIITTLRAGETNGQGK